MAEGGETELGRDRVGNGADVAGWLAWMDGIDNPEEKAVAVARTPAADQTRAAAAQSSAAARH